MNDATQFFNTTAGGGYEIERSLRFNSSDSAYLSRTPASAGNRKTWTWAGWVKRSALGGDQQLFFAAPSASDTTHIRFDSDNTLNVFEYTGSYTWRLQTSQLFRDCSAWYHVHVAIDTTQASSSNRVKIYINGSQVTAFLTANYPALNTDTEFNNTVAHAIGRNTALNGNNFDGYLADIHFIDGQALTPSSFTEVSATTGQLIPKAYSGSFGTNGFWLKFSDNSAATATTLGKDYSGNSNNWTPNNLSVTAGAGNDSLVDTPTNYGTDTGAGGEVRGNYATLNPLDSAATLKNGNLDTDGDANYYDACASIGLSSGKWYFEAVASIIGDGGVGITRLSNSGLSHTAVDSFRTIYQASGGIYRDGTGIGNTTGLSTYGVGDVIGVAFDLDNGTIAFYKNNTLINSTTNSVYEGATNSWKFYVLSQNTDWSVNFGQRPFAYTAPSGFKALCTTNLPDPVVAKPSEVMDVLLYTGDGASTKTVSGLSFSPDFVWMKCRSLTLVHGLANSVAGVNRFLVSNDTVAEYVNDAFGYLSAFNSNGFTLTGGSSNNNTFNYNGETYVAWAWDAGSSTVTNTDGTISSQVRANPSAGFSILTYTGVTNSSTIGHGLGVAPSLIINKSRGGAGQWVIYHAALGFSYYGGFSTAAFVNNSAAWKTSPTSSVYTIGSAAEAPILNTTGETYVSYCFAPVAGYSAFGSYTGNGSTDGPFVYTGFRPAFVLVKGTSTGYIWTIEDSKRDTYNGTSKYLQPQSSAAEGSVSAPHYDFTSNGFKIKTTDSAWNQNSVTYIYAAFAENPFQYSRAR